MGEEVGGFDTEAERAGEPSASEMESSELSSAVNCIASDIEASTRDLGSFSPSNSAAT